jgi:hypothetical protein
MAGQQDPDDVRQRARTRDRKVTPSICGIRMSETTTVTGSVCSGSSASAPPLAVCTWNFWRS